MSISDYIAIIAVAVAFLALLHSIFNQRAADAKDTENRLASLETKISVFWNILIEGAAQILHHPNQPYRDDLIERFLTRQLNSEELGLFVIELETVKSDSSIPAGERMAATLMLAAIKANIVKMERK